MLLREQADKIISSALKAARPDTAVKKALKEIAFPKGRLILIAVGKAAWQMAKAAQEQLEGRICRGVVVTKYDHGRGPIANFEIYEAGHPVPDQNSFLAAQAVINAVSGLSKGDAVLFLLSGGASALFEKPLIPPEDLSRLTKELLSSGADISEINTIRKRFSAVKGGRFARLCLPARVFSVVLSDVLGDRLDIIGSGPAYPDPSTAKDARDIAEKYHLTMPDEMMRLLNVETPKTLENVTTRIIGSVRQLCGAAEKTCRGLGYETFVLTDRLSCTARDAGVFLGNIAGYYNGCGRPMAFLAGGETVVRLTGKGKGGRNQELALAAAEEIAGMNACVFSVGSDGTDGPTDAAGGYVDGTTRDRLKALGIRICDVLAENDSYNALRKCGGLIITGATGTNVNDLSVLLIR